MKTSEEWARTPHIQHGEDFREYIKSIQLDAMKEGAKRAAQIAHDKGNWSIDPTSYVRKCKPWCNACEVRQSIFNVSNKWTKVDLSLREQKTHLLPADGMNATH